MATTSPPPLGESPAYLIAAAYSARQSGDRELERTARKRLADNYGIRLMFNRPTAPESASNRQGDDNG